MEGIMQFSGVLDPATLKRTQACNSRLVDPNRIQAVNNTGLMDAGRQAAFDRLAHLAAKIVNAPLTIVSLVGAEKQYFVADYGLPSPFKESRELSIDSSICRYTLEGESIVSSNAPRDPLLKFHPSTGPWGIVALVVIPLINPDGHVLGTFCAIDSKEREWSDYEINVMRELTISVMTEINLREQLLKLKAEQNLREIFVAALTHDLRTPLSASKLGTQILALKFADREDVQSIVSRIDRNLTHADRMIQDLLDASQIKSGKLISVNVKECEPCEIIRDAIEDLTAMHGNRFELKTSHIRITADPVGIRRIIENLAANAIKYGALDAPVRISLVNHEDRVELHVENKGNPISEADQRTIFEPFQRAASARQSQEKGWGLGLSLVRGIAQAHGGDVAVSSSADRTCFTVTLPLRPTRG
jgi:signal transduction histidine kinase